MGSCLSTSGDSSPTSLSSSRSSSIKKKPKRSLIRKASIRRDDSLSRIPGRKFSNGSSDFASLFTQQGKKGTNQDAMIVWENFCSRSDTIFCGVFDGHGPFGHLVAKRVRDSLPQKLSSHFGVKIDSGSKNGSSDMEESTSHNFEEASRSSIDFEEREDHPDIFTGLKQSFLNAFKVMDKELRAHPAIDCFCSGTTAVTLVKQGHDLVIGNIGDSRAVLGTRDQDDCLIAVQLTVDLKPNLPKEAERIRRCKGRVFALQDEPEVARVWLPNNNSPGLAMARAFGDFCLKDFGLISVPDVSYRRITERDEFIVLATDGIWDVLSNEEVVSIISSAPVRSYAARALVEAAVRSWRTRYPTSRVDDCAAVCLFLNSPENLSSTASAQETYADFPNEVELEENTDPNVSSPTSLDRSATVRSGGGSGDEIEGVPRVDTLISLPRFVPNTKFKK